MTATLHPLTRAPKTTRNNQPAATLSERLLASAGHLAPVFVVVGLARGAVDAVAWALAALIVLLPLFVAIVGATSGSAFLAGHGRNAMTRAVEIAIFFGTAFATVLAVQGVAVVNAHLGDAEVVVGSAVFAALAIGAIGVTALMVVAGEMVVMSVLALLGKRAGDTVLVRVTSAIVGARQGRRSR